MQKRPPENQLRFPNSISVMSFNVTNIIEERCKVSRDFLSFSHLPELGSFCGKITENKTKKIRIVTVSQNGSIFIFY